ncbi:MAG: hypothetical protein MMC33_010393 [Icmadophila ericetorum]|nr:hypothetical protein [Icmadophila ericetorum]
MWLCQCNICRYTSGNLSITVIALPAGSKELQVNGIPKENKTSEVLSRYHCGNCGSALFEKSWSRGLTYLSSGALTEADGVLQIGQQIFIDDTKDGGMAAWLPGVPAWAEWPGSKEANYEVMSSKQAPIAVSEAEKLVCQCQCGGVEFKLRAASKQSMHLFKLISFLLFTHAPNAGSYKGEEFDRILKENRTKYLAGTCVCNDCRRAAGHEFQNWAYVPVENLEKMDGDPMDFSIGTLKKYQHSEKADRYFCENCGATVFWHGARQKDQIDVAVGLMRADSGARAEDWLAWRTHRLSGMPFARSKFLAEALVGGLKQWEERRHGISKE